MTLRLISDCDYELNFIISAKTKSIIKLSPHKSVVLSLPNDIEKIKITPVSIKCHLTLLHKLRYIFVLLVHFLLYYLLLPFSDQNIFDDDYSDMDLYFIDTINLSIGQDYGDVEITYYYHDNELFTKSVSKIECKSLYPLIHEIKSPVNIKQVRKALFFILLQKIMIFIPIIIILTVALVFSVIRKSFPILILTGILLFVFLAIVIGISLSVVRKRKFLQESFFKK